MRAGDAPALYDYKLIFTLLCRDSSSGMVLLRFLHMQKNRGRKQTCDHVVAGEGFEPTTSGL